MKTIDPRLKGEELDRVAEESTVAFMREVGFDPDKMHKLKNMLLKRQRKLLTKLSSFSNVKKVLEGRTNGGKMPVARFIRKEGCLLESSGRIIADAVCEVHGFPHNMYESLEDRYEGLIAYFLRKTHQIPLERILQRAIDRASIQAEKRAKLDSIEGSAAQSDQENQEVESES